MFNKSMQYSYKEQKYQRHKMLKILFVCLIIFLFYNILSSFFISVWVIDNNTMQPGLAEGDRILFSSFKKPSIFKRNKNGENSYDFKRGNIVLIDSERNKDKKVHLRMFDTVIRFFTAQKISIFSGQYYIKRVIALPGDEISMNNYIYKVKTLNSPYSLTEFELAERPYHPSIPQTPEIWNESLPFSDNIDTITIGNNECYVISDDRSNTNDSRTWGPIPYSMITSRAVLRIWPLHKIQFL